MQVKLTSKGQLVIPKPIRDALRLKTGDRLDIQVENERIVLHPSRVEERIEALYGRLAGVDMLSELEEEHRQETLDG